MENHALKILVESKVPFLDGLLEPYAHVLYAHPDSITPAIVKDVDAMIVRTRTRCDAALLDGSRCRFIGTATIGTDHIDLPWCSAHGISVANAPGCNAPAVAQYVFGAIAALKPDFIGDLTIGIVGVGHVGRIVERWARSLDMRVLRCDPPREHAEGGDGWHTINQIAREADVITIHTPLTTDAPYATHHIINESWLASLVRRPLLINAARGAIIDTPAMVSAIDKGLVGRTAIDCWEGEPRISGALLQRADVATPHIAGYSREGKWRASQMILDSLTAFFGLPHIALREPAPAPVPETVTASAIAASYNPLAADTPALKADPYAFESLRNDYVLRTELH